jgi:hypothetical protein
MRGDTEREKNDIECSIERLNGLLQTQQLIIEQYKLCQPPPNGLV